MPRRPTITKRIILAARGTGLTLEAIAAAVQDYTGLCSLSLAKKWSAGTCDSLLPEESWARLEAILLASDEPERILGVLSREVGCAVTRDMSAVPAAPMELTLDAIQQSASLVSVGIDAVRDGHVDANEAMELLQHVRALCRLLGRLEQALEAILGSKAG